MVIGLAALLVVHGLIHLLGAAKAFDLAPLPQLTRPISPLFGALWLVATVLFLATAISLVTWPRGWWLIGAFAVFISMIVIIPSWQDAKIGAVANGIVVMGLVFGFLIQGPVSLRAEYERDVEGRLQNMPSSGLVTDADLTHLPAPVQRYLRVAGVIGQPRVHNFRVRMHGRIRNGPAGRWMSFRAEQHNVIEPPARMFYLVASMAGVPAHGYHRYIGSSASMRVKAAALIPVVSAQGDDMTQSETVTLFNDMCIMAPATLINPGIAWESVDAHSAKARFTNAGHTIGAELLFNAAGELTNFVSDDRYEISADRTSMRQVRWSTPVDGYRSFGSLRLPAGGEGRWHESESEYAYIALTIDDIQYNVERRGSGERRESSSPNSTHVAQEACELLRCQS